MERGLLDGEEPYSLAMMLDELLPRAEKWNVLIVGTDLSEAALAKARSGIYGPWSFRATSPRRRDCYFQAHRSFDAGSLGLKRPAVRDNSDFKVVPRIHQAVTLQPGNLVSDLFPSRGSGLFDMDLIVCRNVFIYFGREAIAHVVEKFSRTLRPGGYLLTGHAELHDAPLHGLQARAFPQTLIYHALLCFWDGFRRAPKYLEARVARQARCSNRGGAARAGAEGGRQGSR